MIEVRHDDLEALAFLAEQVFDRHLRLLELDISSSGSCRVRRLDKLSFHRFAARNEKDREAFRRLHSGDKVVAEHAVGDPLLRSGNEEMLSVFGELCRCADASYVGTGKSLGDGKTHFPVNDQRVP